MNQPEHTGYRCTGFIFIEPVNILPGLHDVILFVLTLKCNLISYKNLGSLYLHHRTDLIQQDIGKDTYFQKKTVDHVHIWIKFKDNSLNSNIPHKLAKTCCGLTCMGHFAQQKIIPVAIAIATFC